MGLLFGIIVGVVIVVALVVLHELGHAIAARRSGVVVEEFGIGFPPQMWAKKYKNRLTNIITKEELIFSLNWLPLGGFVKLKGEYDSAKKKGEYGAASFWQKTRILLAGVLINWLTAAVLLTILAWTGLPKILPDQYSVPSDTKLTMQPVLLGSVVKNSPAERAGLKLNDQLVRFDGKDVTSSEIVSTIAKDKKGQKVEIVYRRAGTEHSVSTTLNKEGKDGYLGVGFRPQYNLLHTTWSAPLVGVGTTIQLTAETFKGLGKLVINLGEGIVAQFSHDQAIKKAGSEDLENAKQSVSGPIGIYGVLFPAATSAGLTMLMFITAVISLSLAVINVLPVPALDGGRWFTMAIFRLLKKPLTKEREESVQTAGFVTLMLLIVAITIVDVSKLIK